MLPIVGVKNLTCITLFLQINYLWFLFIPNDFPNVLIDIPKRFMAQERGEGLKPEPKYAS